MAAGEDSAEWQPISLEVLRRLTQIEEVLTTITKQNTIKDFYSTEEVAEILDRAPFTVREWCRQGRVNAEKRDCGRGTSQEWIISHAELQRVRNHGLLPDGH